MPAIEDIYSKFLTCADACTDTRKIMPGDMFFALKGPNFDGNTYAQKALDQGASYAIIDDSKYAQDERLILVDDVLNTLQQLASHHRDQFKGKVLALTGSNGKTTTKELITTVLRTSFEIHATKGNLNNHIGVPLTLLALDLNADIAVIEMGANHLGEIASYCEVAKPELGLITNIGTAHLGEFGGKENLIRAKSELFDFIRRNGGRVFINMEDEVLRNMAKRFPEPILFPNDLASLLDAAPFVKYSDKNENEHRTNLAGAYNFLNLSAALSIGNHFGVDMNKAYSSLDDYISSDNRSEILKIGTNTIILDAYNANPDSTIAALENLSSFPGTNKKAFLGDMKELGEYSAEQHRRIYHLIIEKENIDGHYVGPEYQDALKDETDRLYPKTDDLISELKLKPLSESVVLIKGSRSMTMEKLIQENDIWK